MKKVFPIIIGILLIGLPITTAISPSNTQLLKPIKENIKNTKITSIKDSPPVWAKGNFSGEWGLDIWGEENIPLGWMIGYFKLSINIGFFAAGFNFFGEPAISWFIQGYIFGIFMFGDMGENEYTNQTFFVGLCNHTRNNYNWRIIGEHGPMFFMRGSHTRFD